MFLSSLRSYLVLSCFLSLIFAKLKAAEVEDYLVTKGSPYSYAETCQRAASKAALCGFQFLSSHSYPSPEKGTEGKYESTVFLYQNERLSNALLQRNPLAALILPFKLIVWKKDQNKTWVTYMLATLLDELDVIEDESLLEQVIREIEHFTDEITFVPLPAKGLS